MHLCEVLHLVISEQFELGIHQGMFGILSRVIEPCVLQTIAVSATDVNVNKTQSVVDIKAAQYCSVLNNTQKPGTHGCTIACFLAVITTSGCHNIALLWITTYKSTCLAECRHAG